MQAGEVLFQIDPAEFEAARAVAAARVQRERATLTEAEAQLARYETLAAKGTASQAKLDEAKAAAGQAKADLAAARAELQQADLDLGYTQIAAPLIRAHQPRRDRRRKPDRPRQRRAGHHRGGRSHARRLCRFRARVSRLPQGPERRQSPGPVIPKLRLANDRALSPATGQMEFLDISRRSRNRDYPACAPPSPIPDGLLLPGLFVTVLLVGQHPEEAILVPAGRRCSRIKAGTSFCFWMQEDRAQVRPVTLGQRLNGRGGRQGGACERASGSSSRVFRKLRPGALVAPVERSAP